MRLLVINPNTSQHMTDGLRPIVDAVARTRQDVVCTFFTAPATNHPGSVASIDSPEDAERSAAHCWPHIRTKIQEYDGFLVACYSVHPLVGMIKEEIAPESRMNGAGNIGRQQRATGIFEASVASSLNILSAPPVHQLGSLFGSFGIVTTGAVWKDALSEGVKQLLSSETSYGPHQFAGVATTGLTARELHEVDPPTVRERISNATQDLIGRRSGKDGGVKVICLGCAGMAGMEAAVRDGIAKAAGERDVTIVDGVRAGIEWLVEACAAQRR